MSKRTLDKDNLLPKAWGEFADDPFNLHTAMDATLLDTLNWEKVGGTLSCMQKNPETKELSVATFLAYGRFLAGPTDYKLVPDAYDGGIYPVIKLRATALLGKAWENDAIPAIDLAASWPLVVSNVNAIIETRNRGKDNTDKDKYAVTHVVKDGSLLVGHRLFMDTADFEKEREIEYDADDIYKPVDVTIHPSLQLKDWPWPPKSKVPDRLHEIKDLDVTISPLPAYYYQGDLLLPKDWHKMKGALVVVHFTLSWTRIDRDKKSVFSADIKRIDFLERPVTFSPTKRARRSSPPTSPSPTPRV